MSTSFALGLICKNEEFYLSRILPIIRPTFDIFVALDGGSTDKTIKVLRAHKCRVYERPWDNNYSNARNEVIRRISADWIFMLDADEAMFRPDITAIRGWVDSIVADSVALPRIEFVGDYRHYDRKLYPDWQCRLFRCGRGYHYRNPVHETLFRGNEANPAISMAHCIAVDKWMIYHYGQCKSPETVWLRHHNYGLILKGERPLDKPPANLNISRRYGSELFNDRHPLE
jgi:glycosyltransferase involved in cell wall biosynthesis